MGSAVAAAIVRRRVGPTVSGEQVLVHNLWRSVEISLTDVTEAEEGLFWWGRGLYGLGLLLADGRHVPIHATCKFSQRELALSRP
jgi:hypothetical protein